MDRFALKQTYYSTSNINPRQDAGFLIGKDGFDAEVTTMEQALAAGIPSLLVDLTNTIRHGDVCFMVGPDPHLVEVKAGQKLDKRGRRQAKSIKQLHEFFEKDHAVGLRGIPEIRRVVHQAAERSYVDDINTCIDVAAKQGHAVSNPERGLYYVAMTHGGPSIGEVLREIKAARPLVFSLNEFKSSRAWAPYSPFILSIRSEAHLYEFLQGRLYVLVVVDLDVLCAVAAQKGFAAQLDSDDEEYPLKISKAGQEGQAAISAHMLRRIGLEFTSPEWIVDAALEGFDRNVGKPGEAAPVQVWRMKPLRRVVQHAMTCPCSRL